MQGSLSAVSAQCVCPEVSVQSAARWAQGPPVICRGGRDSLPRRSPKGRRLFRKDVDWRGLVGRPRGVPPRSAPSFPVVPGGIGSFILPRATHLRILSGMVGKPPPAPFAKCECPPPGISPRCAGQGTQPRWAANGAQTWVRSAAAIASATPLALPRASHRYPWKASDAHRPQRLTTAESRYADHRAEAPPNRRL